MHRVYARSGRREKRSLNYSLRTSARTSTIADSTAHCAALLRVAFDRLYVKKRGYRRRGFDKVYILRYSAIL